jgi:hypothetical protein
MELYIAMGACVVGVISGVTLYAYENSNLNLVATLKAMLEQVKS